MDTIICLYSMKHKEEIKGLMGDDKTPAPILLGALLASYGPICMSWEPEVLRQEINESFDVEISDLQSDKIQAAVNLLLSDDFQRDYQVFETTCRLFNNRPDDFETEVLLEWEEMVNGVTDVMIITSEVPKYSDDVRVYIGRVLEEYGMSAPPKQFKRAIMDEFVTGSVESKDDEKEMAIEELMEARTKHVASFMKDFK